MTLDQFFEEYFRTHPEKSVENLPDRMKAVLRYHHEKHEEWRRENGIAGPGRCVNCNKPLDDHIQGRCPK